MRMCWAGVVKLTVLLLLRATQTLCAVPAGSVEQWCTAQPSAAVAQFAASALSGHSRKLQRCLGPLLSRMSVTAASSIASGFGEIVIPPALKLKETTCLVVSPKYTALFTGAAQAEE